MNEQFEFFKATSGTTTVTVYHVPEGSLFKGFGGGRDLLVENGDSIITRTEIHDADHEEDTEFSKTDQRPYDLIERIRGKENFQVQIG